jgi:hypothetical protein
MTDKLKSLENIESISTEDAIPKNKEDKKCAPGRKYEDGSCFKTHELFAIVDAHNKTHTNDKIELNIDNAVINSIKSDLEKHSETKGGDNSYKDKFKKYEKKLRKILLGGLHKKLGHKCKSQKCWLEQGFMDNINEETKEHLQKNVLRPDGPSTGRKWLNTVNIDEVLNQYELIHKDFKYLGTMPRDFQKFDELKQDKNFYKNLAKEGKTKLAMVYNTDKIGGDGEHWNAMFADLNKGTVYFFDSYGVDPNKETKAHMKLLEDVMKELCGEDVNVHSEYNHTKLMKGSSKTCGRIQSRVNDKRHQYKGSECGVYSINFIERMLHGDNFDDISNSKIPDDEINKRREIYFYKE